MPEAAAVAEPLEEEELPDWLQELQVRAEPSLSYAVTVPEGDPAEPPLDVAEHQIDQADLPPVQASVIEMPALVDGMPAWLTTLEAEIGAQAVAATSGVAEEALATERPAEGAAVIDMPPPADDMPLWLSELEAEIGGQPSASVHEQELAQPGTAIPDPEESTQDTIIEMEVLPAQPVVTAEAVDRLEAMQEPPADEQVPDWLHELESQVSAAEESVVAESGTDMRAGPTEEGGPPTDQETALWLDSDQIDIRPRITAENLPIVEEDSPDWLLELQAEPITEVTVEEMPDLLEQLRPGEAVQAIETRPAEPMPEEPESGQEMAWLRDLEEMVVPEPIEAQGEIPTLKQVVASHTTAATEPATEPSPDVAVQAPQPDQVADPAQSLVRARAYLEQGSSDEAVGAYEHLVTVPSLSEDVIYDLEQAVQTYPRHHALQRVLGDAYMHSGQLQKALDAYRQALTKL